MVFQVINPWSPQDDERLVELIREGLEQQEIALKMGRSVSGIKRRRKKFKLELQKKRRPAPAKIRKREEQTEREKTVMRDLAFQDAMRTLHPELPYGPSPPELFSHQPARFYAEPVLSGCGSSANDCVELGGVGRWTAL